MADVLLQKVRKNYNPALLKDTLRNINLDIKDGDFIVFVGPSGCGKSTLLRMIAGLEDITDGDLMIGGKRVNDVPPSQRNIGMVFQSYALYPHMSVYDNIAFSLKLKKVPKDEIDRKVREAARILDLEQLLKRKPAALSGGQRQRVAMGRAIVRNPKVFLMDEPLSNLDAKLRGQMRVEISKLHQELGATIIYVTHDQTEAMTLGTRIVVMKDGVVQQIDTPENLYNHPVNKFVAGFIGMPVMNMADADVGEEDGTVTLSFADQKLYMRGEKGRLLREKGYIGSRVTVGIRHEAISEVPGRAEVEVPIHAKTSVYEMLGAEGLLYFAVGGETWVATVSPSLKAVVGDERDLYMDVTKMHLFDIETENAITD